ncbi:LysR substrate-binding domain-containing protein [Sphingomonas bacterium]|uniref:LysR substrate-binding domain-containing protein n=1 Tax=Sphingomonas bacterium TaxID=1895847 RepID=UPI0015770E77|nr:LysR substrate-binding domain-containing protein [Sphingomonas bacterium]
MKLSHLRDVIAVAEHGSLRAAGRQIGVAQPAITRSIREVEQELGATLFERHARGVRLTEIGAAFVRRASAVHSELRRAREEVDQLKGRNVGEVAVSLSTASSLSLMPSAVKAFRKRCPDALLKISESFFRPIEADILAGAVDFYVGPIDIVQVSQQFTVEKLFDNRRLILARKDHPLANARKLSDLVDAEWVRPVLSGNNADVDVDLLFEEQGYDPPRVALHARSAMVMLLVIMNSDLLTILPEQWLDFPLLSNLVAPLPLDEPIAGVPICIVRRRDMPLTPLAEIFCDLMRRAALNYVHRRDAERGP